MTRTIPCLAVLALCLILGTMPASADTIGDAMDKAFSGTGVVTENRSLTPGDAMDVFETPGAIQVNHPDDYDIEGGWRPYRHQETGAVFMLPSNPITMKKTLCEKTGRIGYWIMAMDKDKTMYMASIVQLPEHDGNDVANAVFEKVAEEASNQGLTFKVSRSGEDDIMLISAGDAEKRRIHVVRKGDMAYKLDQIGTNIGDVPAPFFTKRKLP